MSKSLKWGVVLTLAVTFFFMGAQGVMAGKYNIRAATVLVEKSPAAKALYMFKDIVESQTHGEVSVEVFPNGSLGSERENIEALQLNNLQLCIPSVGVLANFSPEMRTLNIPFVLTSSEVAYKVLVKDPIKDKLLAPLKKVGLVGLSFGDYGMRNVTSKKEIKTLADLKNFKIRTMKVPDHLALWEALGASPTPVSFTELYGALQQGVVQGQENPWETIFLSKFYEVQDYVTVTGHIYDVQPMVMSKKFYDRLPEKYKKTIHMAVDISTDYMWYITAQQNDMFKEKVLKAGMKVNTFSKSELAKCRKLTEHVTEKIKEVAGEELVNEYLNALEKYK
ncbi:TRAP transporter substrate-binding protein [Desulfobacula sp.]